MGKVAGCSKILHIVLKGTRREGGWGQFAGGEKMVMSLGEPGGHAFP